MQKKLSTFSDVDSFLKVSRDYSPSTQVYVDSNLGEGLSGEELSEEIYKRGFKNIFLVTGLPSFETKPAPWIKGIMGKDAPWQ